MGEAAVRDQDAIAGILKGLAGGPARGARDFWRRLCARMRDDRPLAKICGITNRDDAELAVELGADMIGFVFADSPRKADAVLVRELADLDVLKVAVVVTGGEHGGLSDEVRGLLDEGLIDAVQFHGDEKPDECAAQAFPYYKAVRLGEAAGAGVIAEYRSPRVLVDARDSRAYGGTGKQLSPEIVAAAADVRPLWLAGGLSDENIGKVASMYRPELVDVSSGLEAAPGRKDPVRMRRFFTELRYE
ncbi:MAG TPA: phosphoribosylanthranilate isomerase [Myxococcota bacterium]|nr:phosphoribosylanthranilate isomerase [Myxococcota bacterium]